MSNIDQQNNTSGPRERLRLHGPKAVSDADLLAVVLGTGCRNEPVQALAVRLLGELGGLAGLRNASPQVLAARRGLGLGKACRLTAALELGVRVSARPFHPRRAVRSSRDVAAALRPGLRDESREHFFALLLDSRNRPLAERIVAVGSLESCTFTVADAFRSVVREAAAAVVFVHNHPSGEPSPSEADRSITRQLEDAAVLLGVRMLDHVVLGATGYFSFLDAGLLARPAATPVAGVASEPLPYGKPPGGST